MLQGTGSSVGKSLLVAGLARAARLRGLRVMPFKPQNMSNNAAVAADGGEIGRAQALQARAAGVPPSVHMNPVLLKPQSETGAQVVLRGRVHATANARAYQAMKPELLPFVLDSFRRLQAECDVVLVEGAGSASEVNLRAGDIANMGFARATRTPVALVGDIDRGGVIASLVGTKAVLDPDDAAMIVGFVVNRMRGDASLFEAGMAAIVRHTGWRALGLVPFFDAARLLPAEDAGDISASAGGVGPVRIAVPLLPHIANFDDLDPLAAEPDVSLVLVPRGTPLPCCELVILLGSKATRSDLRVLKAEGWDIDLAGHRRRGGMILGLCGGFQMLGGSVADPDGIEGPAGVDPGLGMLAVNTILAGDKRVAEAAGVSVADAAPFRGYEIHVGTTSGPDIARPLLRFADGRVDGAVSADGRVLGTYVHGLFGDDAQRRHWLERLGGRSRVESHDAQVEAVLDALARHLEAHMDVAGLFSLAG